MPTYTRWSRGWWERMVGFERDCPGATWEALVSGRHRGHQVHQSNQGWPPALRHTHTHMHTTRGRGGGGVKTQSAVDKRMMIHTRTGANRGTYCMSSMVVLSVTSFCLAYVHAHVCFHVQIKDPIRQTIALIWIWNMSPSSKSFWPTPATVRATCPLIPAK